MTEEQYLAICRACDDLLRADDSTRDRMAIAWLHVIREHPVFLHRYEPLFTPGHRPGSARVRRLRYFGGWAAGRVGELARGGSGWEASAEPASPMDVLFVSHLVNAGQAGRETDGYFADLPSRLHDDGLSVGIALLSHVRGSLVRVAARWSTASVPRFVLSRSLPLKDEAGIFRRMRAEARRLRERAKDTPEGLGRSVADRAAAESLSVSTADTMRVGEQVARLVAKYRPRAVVTTYEGHAYERVIWDAVREVAPGTVCIAYQHASISRLQHAIRRRLSASYDPDRVVTSGVVGREQLEKTGSLQGIPIEVLGSDRGFDLSDTPGRSADPPTCIVLPEGIVSECNLLFEFSLRCAASCPDVRFLWRLHPLIDFTELVAANPSFRALPPNVALSGGSLAEDARRSRWALYRGTTAIIQAVGAGAVPVYLRVPGEMSIDPLYELGESRPIISEPAEFNALMHWRADAESSMQMQARRYCSEMFSPFDINVLRSAIDQDRPGTRIP